MCNYRAITFDFYQLKISTFHQGEMVTLHGAMNKATMDLVKKMDLRRFLQAKRRCCATSIQAGEVVAEVQGVPEPITAVLNQYSEVF